jgi:hypothetical protein
MKHILLEKAKVFEQEKKNLDPLGCTYDIEKGVWLIEESGEKIALVRSQNPNKPISGTKKADVETGEDQKGM